MEEVFVAIAFGLIPVVAFAVLLFIWNLIRAPVYIKFEKEREPRLIVENDTSECNHKLGYSWRLKIKNNGIDVAENCRGQLVGFDDEVPEPNWGWHRWPKNEFLSWADGNIATRIQSKQTIELEVMYGGGYGQYLYLAYARGEDFRQDYAPKGLRGNVLLVIMITYNEKLPIYAVCLFHKHSAWAGIKGLELKAITSERPDITLYQRPNSHKEGSQT